ncbi:hypothetical protein BDP27DRAFT_1430728 [Rhodocollybia butyracea]|uniref:Uncharacterized protein n=1 Tax=Rhodocollybia butyracea TaxID=206335 RepID=A0A9P5P6P9_9AGAR|nr:hypothetical protein BDP27DRAFT_1430728 [Rhodocollybia butyracea]
MPTDFDPNHPPDNSQSHRGRTREREQKAVWDLSDAKARPPVMNPDQLEETPCRRSLPISTMISGSTTHSCHPRFLRLPRIRRKVDCFQREYPLTIEAWIRSPPRHTKGARAWNAFRKTIPSDVLAYSSTTTYSTWMPENYRIIGLEMLTLIIDKRPSAIPEWFQRGSTTRLLGDGKPLKKAFPSTDLDGFRASHVKQADDVAI